MRELLEYLLSLSSEKDQVGDEGVKAIFKGMITAGLIKVFKLDKERIEIGVE